MHADGPTPKQGTPSDPGLDCGVFTMAFAMQISLCNKQFDFGQADIPVIRNWIAHTIISYGKRNETYDMEPNSLEPSGSNPQSGASNAPPQIKRRLIGDDDRDQKSRKTVPQRRIPGALAPRGLVNAGDGCVINAAKQICFHVPAITSLLELLQVAFFDI